MLRSSSKDSQWLSIGEPAAGQQEICIVIEAPRRRDLRFQDAQRARGRVARVGEAGEAAFIALGIQPFESLPVQHRFAAHFEFGELALGAQRQRADGARVFGDLLAHHPVAARHGLNELAVAIVRGHGKPVHLEFGDVAILARPPAVRPRGDRRPAVRLRSEHCPGLTSGSCARTLTKPSRGLPPTRRVGESGVASSGCSVSSSCSRRIRTSYSASEISGVSKT